MNKVIVIGVMFLGLSLFVSCTNESSSTKTLLEEEDFLFQYQLLMTGDTAVYSIRVDYQLLDNSEDYLKENITKIVLTYPHIDSFRNKAIMDSVNKIISGAILSDVVGVQSMGDLKVYMKTFIDDYKNYKKEMRSFGLHFSTVWFYDLKINVLLNTPNLLSLQINKLEFTGGAHANPWTSYLNIDLRTGEVLELKDLLVENYEAELLITAETAFKNTANLQLDSSLADSPYEFSSGNFELPEHFSIGKHGISFYYNPYDLGPYALGSVSFDVPYEELLGLVNKERLVLEAIKVEQKKN